MPRRLHPWFTLLLALTLFACTTSGDPLPDEFDAGPIDDFPPQSVVTFADRIEVQRAAPGGTVGDNLFEGDLVFHLVRLESGEFLAFSAEAERSVCWVFWEADWVVWPPAAGRSGTDPPADALGWFRDPCRGGGVYDRHGLLISGGASRDLDRYPVEVREDRVHITLTAAALIPGETHDGPTATPTPQPVPTRPGSLSTIIPTPHPTATSGGPAATATPVTGPPWTAADYLSALEAQDIHVKPGGHGIACTEVGGLRGTEFIGDANFTLWVYPSAEAAAAEWMIAPYEARHPVLACNRAPARIYALDNLVLRVPAEIFDEAAIRVANTFLRLANKPLPSELHGSTLWPPAAGHPFAADDLLDALDRSFAPYAQPLCQYDGPSSRQLMVGPFEGSDTMSFQLWVYPSIAELQAGWELGVDGQVGYPGVHRSQNSGCAYVTGTIYRNANMLLMFNSTDWVERPAEKAAIVDALFALEP